MKAKTTPKQAEKISKQYLLATLPNQGSGASLPATLPAPAAHQVATVIDRAINNPKLDVKKMQSILDMQMQVMRYQAEVAYNVSMQACQAELPQIEANAKNEHTKSKYADLGGIDTIIRPIYTKHGFSLEFDTEEKDGGVRIICWVRHKQGHKERRQLTGNLDLTGSKGTANKTSIQATGSTVSYLQRYLTKLIFNVVIKGEDNDGADKPPKQEDEFSAKVKGEGRTIDNDEPEWNGTTLYFLQGVTHEGEFKNDPTVAFRYLKDFLLRQPKKARRIEILNKNLSLIRALAKTGNEGMIAELHAAADSGE